MNGINLDWTLQKCEDQGRVKDWLRKTNCHLSATTLRMIFRNHEIVYAALISNLRRTGRIARRSGNHHYGRQNSVWRTQARLNSKLYLQLTAHRGFTWETSGPEQNYVEKLQSRLRIKRSNVITWNKWLRRQEIYSAINKKASLRRNVVANSGIKRTELSNYPNI